MIEIMIDESSITQRTDDEAIAWARGYKAFLEAELEAETGESVSVELGEMTSAPPELREAMRRAWDAWCGMGEDGQAEYIYG